MSTDDPDAVVRYGSHPEQLADVRLAVGGTARALILLVHGGFWRQDYDRHHTDAMAADLALRGYTVASLEYRRLGGAGGWPATFDDLAAAVDRVPLLVEGVTPSSAAAPTDRALVEGVTQSSAAAPVVLLGHSAGGHLALWAAGRHTVPLDCRWRLPAAPRVDAVVALAPVADLAHADELGLDDGVVAELIGARDPQRAQRLAQLDPRDLTPAAPVVIVHGDQDRHVPLELSRRYAESVRARGAEVELDVVVGAEHFALIDPTSTSWPRVLAGLTRHHR